MAAPADPYDQPLIQETPSLGTNVGSVAPGRFITWGFDETVDDYAFILWRILNGLAVRINAVASPGFSLYQAVENDSGVIAIRGNNGGNDIAAHLKPDLTFDFFDIPIPDNMWVSGDGQEIVISSSEYNFTNDGSDTHIYGFSLTGTPLWDFVIDTSTNIYLGVRPSGYIVGVPRAGRVLWDNTTPRTVDNLISTSFTGVGTLPDISWVLSGTADDSPPFPVIHQLAFFRLWWSGRTEFGYNPSHPWPDYETGAQAAYIDGVVVKADLNTGGWAPSGFYVGNSVSKTVSVTAPGDSFSYTLEVDPFYGPTWNEYWSANEFTSFSTQYGGGGVWVTYDLSEWHGGNYELYDSSGDVLDRLEVPIHFQNDTQWIGIGSNAFAGFPLLLDGGGE